MGTFVFGQLNEGATKLYMWVSATHFRVYPRCRMRKNSFFFRCQSMIGSARNRISKPAMSDDFLSANAWECMFSEMRAIS